MSHASLLVNIANTKDIEKEIQYQMEPFKENGWFSDGSRWDWYQIGGRYSNRIHNKDIILIKELSQELLLQEKRDRYNQAFKEATKELVKDQKAPVNSIYGFDPREESVDDLMLNESPLNSYAFLRNRHWNEAERLGWFGSTMATECEIKNPNDADVAVNKCLFVHEETGARIIVWNEPQELWSKNFWKRFIEPLDPESLLIMVDYHV